MDLNTVCEVKQKYVGLENEELSSIGAAELHRELYENIKLKECLEASKKAYSQTINETLKLVNARLQAVTTQFDERGV